MRKLNLDEEQVESILGGRATKVEVDKKIYGVSTLMVVGLFPGTADVIEKLTKSAEESNAKGGSLDYIKRMNKKGKPGERGKSQLKEGTYEPKGMGNPPKVSEVEKTMGDYLKGQQDKK